VYVINLLVMSMMIEVMQRRHKTWIFIQRWYKWDIDTEWSR